MISNPQNQQFQRNFNHQQIFEWIYGKLIYIQNIPTQQELHRIIYNQDKSISKDRLRNTLILTTYPFTIQQYNCPILLIQSSQQNKSFETLQKILDFFIANNANRNTIIIVKGGGMLMDIGNFAASIYMRGIKNVILMPTTFLGMVDATIGGKTAINYANAKNNIGITRNPNTIIICPQFLKSQSKRQFFNGMVETIKMALTYDAQFFSYLEKVNFQTLRNQENINILLKIIKKSLKMKKKVVQKDLNQQNERKWLNFGHTIGHGIELDQNNTLLHGQCVAIGMVKAIQLSQKLGIITDNYNIMLLRLIKILKKLELPIEIPNLININSMIKRMLMDKKKSSLSKNIIDFVLIEQIGKPCKVSTAVNISDLRQVLSDGIEIGFPFDKTKLNLINNQFFFPSSKSISLRYLYISCLAYYINKKYNKFDRIVLKNFLISQDTEKMIVSLQELGFSFDIDYNARVLSIEGFKQKEFGELDVGNSGITARFILPLCFLIKEWNKDQINKYLNYAYNIFKDKLNIENNNFVFLYQQIQQVKQKNLSIIKVQGNQSSQFISSAMINFSFINKSINICFKSSNQDTNESIVSESYLDMTKKCLQTFGIKIQFNKKNFQIQVDSSNIKIPKQISIEKDLSTYSYPYVLYEFFNYSNAAIQSKQFMQGDVLFYDYIQDLKSKINSQHEVVSFDFNNCTDTFMTFSILACHDKVTTSSIKKIIIENISNQRIKQSNRIHLTINNLKKVGIQVQQYENKIIILPKHPQISENKTIIFETNDDHRLAMSFGILSTYLSKKFPKCKFIIDSKKAVQKTFPEFWKYLKESGINLNFISVQEQKQKLLNFAPIQKNNYKISELNSDILKESIILIGNRGSGKTTIGSNVATALKLGFLDLDDLITEQIKQSFKLDSIQQMVDKFGWDQFRAIQSNILQKTLSSLRYSERPFIISTGGGILEKELNRFKLQRQKSNIFYLERPFDQLKINQTDHRPSLQNFKEISKKRQKLYEKYASQIITFPKWSDKSFEARYVIDSIEKYLGKEKVLKQGYILSLGQQLLSDIPQTYQVNTVEIRVDKLLKGKSFGQVRQAIAQYRFKHIKDIILTLRTKEQLGQFQGKDYEIGMKRMSQIPCDFLDHQIRRPINYPYNFNKLLLSYHGNNENVVNKLISQPYGFKKFCYLPGTNNLYQRYKSKFDRGICIDLKNPLTRLSTKYQMIIPETCSATNGIMNIKQMQTLIKMFKFL